MLQALIADFLQARCGQTFGIHDAGVAGLVIASVAAVAILGTTS